MDPSAVGGLIHIIGGSLIFSTILFVALSSQFGGGDHAEPAEEKAHH
ncbi:MAG: hypothetical protein IT462_00325 [Planctomycetes bacterium]|nr:hypothetical protein [Planctomycetota bacterium]